MSEMTKDIDLKDLTDNYEERIGMSLQKLVSLKTQKTPIDLGNVEKAVSVLKEIKDNNARIIIFSDIDCDGLMSGVVSFSALKAMGFNAVLFTRNKEYGFLSEHIDEMISRGFGDGDYILTSDVGSNAYETVSYGIECGFKFIITDHHLPSEDMNLFDEEDVVQINPTLNANPYNICGCATVYEVLNAYAKMYEPSVDLSYLKLFVGVATISDAMLLYGQNIDYVKSSLIILRRLLLSIKDNTQVVITGNEFFDKVFESFKNLLNCFVRDNKVDLDAINDIDETFYGFQLAPLINCVKRLNIDLSVFYVCFFPHAFNVSVSEEDYERFYNFNATRKEIVNNYYEQILYECENERLEKQPFYPYIYFTQAPSGILGLLATKLLKQTGFVSIVLNKDDFSGSARSEFDAYSFLKDLGVEVGGHNQAFGCNFGNSDMCLKVTQKLNELANNFVKNENDTRTKTKELGYLDGYLCANDISEKTIFDFLHFKKVLAPFGQGVPVPRFDLYVELNVNNMELKVLGSESKHFKIMLEDFELIFFNQPESLVKLQTFLNSDEARETKTITLYVSGEFGKNEFRENITLQFRCEFLKMYKGSITPNDLKLQLENK